MDSTENGGGEDRRPTPVRMAMESSEAEVEEQVPAARTLPDPDGGEEWVVRVAGRSSSGILPLRTISLIEVVFSRVQEPDKPLRRAICRGRALEELDDEDLLGLLRDSRPFESPEPGDEGRRRRNPRGKPRQ